MWREGWEERESKSACAHVPVPPIVRCRTVLHRETTLPSYLSLFHIASTHPPLAHFQAIFVSSTFFFLFLFSLLFLSLRFSVYIFLACSSLPILLSVLSLLCPPMMQPADSLPPSFRKFRVLIIPPCFLCPLARVLANVLEHISRGGRNRARLP